MLLRFKLNGSVDIQRGGDWIRTLSESSYLEFLLTLSFAKCSINTLKQCWQCYQLPEICPRIRDFFKESLSWWIVMKAKKSSISFCCVCKTPLFTVLKQSINKQGCLDWAKLFHRYISATLNTFSKSRNFDKKMF